MYTKQAVYEQYGRAKREETVREYLPLVYKIARQVSNATAIGALEYNDLVNTGVLGLYKALDKFDETKGYAFAAFASHHVKGAMLDDLSKSKQIPRGLRDKQSKVKRAMEHVSQILMREPTDEEIARHLGIHVEQYNQWLVDLGWTTAWSLEDLESVGTIGIRDEDVFVNPAERNDQREQRAELYGALKKLSDREQKVLYLYYEEELTLKEIAYVLELSESQISRIHSKTVLKLKQLLEAEG